MPEKISNFFKDLIGEENEIPASINMALKDRLTSPFYGYFIIAWLVINWNFAYTLLFIDQDKVLQKTGLLKNEYLLTLIPSFFSLHHWLNFIIYPFLLTFFFFWIAPTVTREFYKKSIRNHRKLRIIELKETTQETKEEKNLVKEEVGLIKEEAQRAKQKKKVEEENPEVLWEREFEEFKKNKNFSLFTFIIDSVYTYNGYIQQGNFFKVPKDILVYADSNDLIVISNNDISLTEKGKFFVKKFSA